MMHTLLALFAAPGDDCDLNGGGFLGFPHWYQYLHGTVDAQNKCTPTISGINDVWAIVAAIIEILLRIAAIAAVGIVIYGAVSYMTSQGEPDKTGRAKGTIVNALVGLAIAVSAGAIIAFLAGRIS